MEIITTREFMGETKKFFDKAEHEPLAVKHGKKYVRLVVTDEPNEVIPTESWINEFLEIPAEFRVNPFLISPSGDLFFADRRNVEHVEQAMADAKKGSGTIINGSEELEKFLDSL
ncbi:MAG: hypothetical protein ACK5LR_10185 [Mangrovibacterium sp.]